MKHTYILIFDKLIWIFGVSMRVGGGDFLWCFCLYIPMSPVTICNVDWCAFSLLHRMMERWEASSVVVHRF